MKLTQVPRVRSTCKSWFVCWNSPPTSVEERQAKRQEIRKEENVEGSQPPRPLPNLLPTELLAGMPSRARNGLSVDPQWIFQGRTTSMIRLLLVTTHHISQSSVARVRLMHTPDSLIRSPCQTSGFWPLTSCQLSRCGDNSRAQAAARVPPTPHPILTTGFRLWFQTIRPPDAGRCADGVLPRAVDCWVYGL